MVTRRDFAIGAACVAGAAIAYAAKPRRLVSLMPPGRKLAEILPQAFDGWTSQDTSDLVAPSNSDSLAARLYGETVCRIFSQQDGPQVTMLMAHGDIQSNELQLHRPEVCYPAFGYTVSESAPMKISVAHGVSIPGRKLIASLTERKEAVFYWTRLGEFFPTTVTEQRVQRLETAMRHYIPDGILARFSIVGSDFPLSINVVTQFVPTLIKHVTAANRAALIGTERASLLSHLA